MSDNMEQPRKNNPGDFLATVLGRPVVVKLNSGVDYRVCAPASASAKRQDIFTSCAALGVLACLDGYTNIAMEQTKSVNGQLKAGHGDTFIRGNNGVGNLITHTACLTIMAHCAMDA